MEDSVLKSISILVLSILLSATQPSAAFFSFNTDVFTCGAYDHYKPKDIVITKQPLAESSELAKSPPITWAEAQDNCGIGKYQFALKNNSDPNSISSSDWHDISKNLRSFQKNDSSLKYFQDYYNFVRAVDQNNNISNTVVSNKWRLKFFAAADSSANSANLNLSETESERHILTIDEIGATNQSANMTYTITGLDSSLSLWEFNTEWQVSDGSFSQSQLLNGQVSLLHNISDETIGDKTFQLKVELEDGGTKHELATETVTLESWKFTDLTWTEQFGSSNTDVVYGIAVDSNNNIYLGGFTRGNLGRTNAGTDDALLVKYNSAGNQVWTKQFGTSSYDYIYEVAVDSNDNIYVTGYTDGNLFGTSVGSRDAFLVKYDSAGNQVWTKQFGTSSSDQAQTVAVDSNNNIYVAGLTRGNLGRTNAGSNDAFLVKYNSAGNQVWTRQFGTSVNDYINEVAVDSNNNIYLAGSTGGNLGGTSSGADDAFLVKYNSAGSQNWTRQFGTNGLDSARAVAVDSNNNIYVGGNTQGNLGGTNAGSNDAFLVKYDSAGNQVWTRQFGTSNNDSARAVAVDSNNNIYVGGNTQGNLGGTSAGSQDAFLVKYNSASNQNWTKQFGSSNNDSDNGIAVDSNNNIYMAGFTYGNLDGHTSAGSGDAFLVKYKPFDFIK